MSDDSSRLPARAEALLAGPATPDLDWEAQAESIERRLLEVALGSTDAALLAAPLPQQPGEPEAPASGLSTPPRTEPTFAELARKVLPKSARHEASQLYKESLSVAAAARASSDATFERVRSVPSPAAPRVTAPPANTASVTPAEQSASASARAPSAAAPAVQEPTTSQRSAASAVARPRGAGAPFLAGVGVSIAAAAALVLFFQSRGPTEGPVTVAERTASTVANAPTTSAAPPAPEERSSAEAADQGVPLDALPRESATTQAIPGSGTPADASSAPPAPAGNADAPRVAGVPRAAPAAPAAGRTKGPAAGATDPTSPPLEAPISHPKLRPAAGASGGLADKPSTGAVQAALGSVMTSARRCLAGSTTAASAVVVFRADGAVSGVSVTPAGAAAPCIESAFSRARVGPFAAGTFTVKVPVRP